MSPTLHWDVFCRVIDNHGDLGVCWRLAAELAERGHRVRLWCDDASALAWMAPAGHARVSVHPWPDTVPARRFGKPGDVVVEAFGCEIAPEFAAACASGTSTSGQNESKIVWLNLEYLSAEGYVERCHRLPSLITSGPAAGMTRWFFYPGFTPRTGGLLREADLAQRQATFDRTAWRARHGVGDGTLALSLFCYEPAGLEPLLAQLAPRDDARLLVTPGRATAAVQALVSSKNAPQRLPGNGFQLSISYLAAVPQAAFDEMLWGCDVNFVRGEDSLVRALWAGQPFVWHIYPQPEDDAHHAKLQAFLDWLQAPASLRRFHAVWNGIAGGPLPLLDNDTLAEWRGCVQAARARLLMQDDLVTQLLGFVNEKS